MGLNFNIALTGLQTAQKYLNVTQNNITNIETQGYARQRLETIANEINIQQGVEAEMGAGVIPTQVTRIVDEMLVQQFRNQNSLTSYYNSLSSELSHVESVFDETGEGSVANMMEKFFFSWEEAAKFPEEMSYRINLLGAADQLAGRFNAISDQLGVMQKEMKDKLETQTKEVNDLINKIAEINHKISRLTTDRPNSLLDERDKYIDELSKYGNVDITYDTKNPAMATVKLGGMIVVNDVEGRNVNLYHDEKTGSFVLATSGVPLRIENGSLKGMLEINNDYIPKYNQQLSTLVSTIISEVNNLHKTGFGLDNTTGENFFYGTDAGSIKVSNVLKTNPEKIGMASGGNVPGNSDIAKEIAKVYTNTTMSSGTVSPKSYYNSMVINMASEVRTATSNAMINDNVLTSTEAQKQQVQGVNLDEEMANLMKFQHYYAANSKAIKTVDDTFNALFGIFS